jgi:uncharacterized protein (DUF1015 family)
VHGPVSRRFRRCVRFRKLAAKVASVPYDVVNREEAAALAAGNPLSFLHVVRPDIDFPPSKNPYDPDVYDQAAQNFQKLVRDGVLARDPADCVYAYRQIMGSHSQVGIVCCCHIDDYENNLILKHEKTRKSKEDDRTRHVLALNANAGPVFLTYRGVEEINFMVASVTKQEPLYDFVAADGVQHTVWRIEGRAAFCRSAFSRAFLLHRGWTSSSRECVACRKRTPTPAPRGRHRR